MPKKAWGFSALVARIIGQSNGGAPASTPEAASSRSQQDRMIADRIAGIVARNQAPAKREDDGREARPAPPRRNADRAAHELAQGWHLAVRHVFPPRHPQGSMSFLGGVPIGPDNFDWPMIHNRDGSLEPLTFMGQISLATLPPAPARALFPETGHLYFFAPMSGNFDESADHFVVRYEPGPARATWGPQHNPGLLAPIEGADAPYVFPWMNWRDTPQRAYPRFYPRTEIELGWIEDDSALEEDDADGPDGLPSELAVQEWRERLIAFHGAPAAYDPVLSSRDKPTDRLWIPFEGFPTNARAAEILMGFLANYLKEEITAVEARLELPPSPPDAAGKQRLDDALAALKNWRDRVAPYLESGGAAALPEEAKAAILCLLEQVRAGALPPEFVNRRYAHESLPALLNEWLSTAAIESVECALTDPDAVSQVPPAVVEAIRYRHSALKGAEFMRTGWCMQHQMLGRGRVIQTADEIAQEHILLLQLSPDEALGWRMGDNGALQYWIHPADFVAHRFEKAFLTIESH